MGTTRGLSTAVRMRHGPPSGVAKMKREAKKRRRKKKK